MATDVEVYDDDFDDEILFDLPSITECIIGNIQGAFNNIILAILIVNLCTKILISLPLFKRDPIADIIMIIGGLSLILFHFRDNLWITVNYFLFFAIGFIISTKTSTSRPLWVYIVLSIGLNEILVHYDSVDFIRLRIYFMCTSMKFIALQSSLAAYHQKGTKINSLRIMCYIFHPSSLPFCSYFPPNLSRSAYEWSKFNLIGKSIRTLFISLIFLAFSNCISIYLNGYLEEFLYSNAANLFPLEAIQFMEKYSSNYFTALQFRTSHYFVCYLIQSSHQLWANDIVITKPFQVEFPRSLSSVVIAWDIPMHKWLKNYVFVPVRKKYGTGMCIFITYLASSYIHGFRFEIWAVLLSLGFLTWTEAKVREIFSREFNACLSVRSCTYQSAPSCMERLKMLIPFSSKLTPSKDQVDCNYGHLYTPRNSLWVVFSNFYFSIITIIHLAYLGSSFDLGEEASSMSYVIGTWENIGFYSHIIGVLTLVIYFLMK